MELVIGQGPFGHVAGGKGAPEGFLRSFELFDLGRSCILDREAQDRAVDQRCCKEKVAERVMGHVGNPRAPVQLQRHVTFSGELLQHLTQWCSRQAIAITQFAFFQSAAGLALKRQDFPLQVFISNGFGCAAHVGHGSVPLPIFVDLLVYMMNTIATQ